MFIVVAIVFPQNIYPNSLFVKANNAMIRLEPRSEEQGDHVQYSDKFMLGFVKFFFFASFFIVTALLHSIVM